ncbi:hypothetical protein P742_0108235 [Enterococcus faecium UC8668]|uniref:hypothetical protein n=1 Tax=Enterococcus faecium TaxID=1352 RepID=UPI00040521A8|nr:hypothetical protein [Enterococcus faecium]KEI50361.1 hypothetical protein P742_0108235 [Enterococcus faecium UC8668]
MTSYYSDKEHVEIAQLEYSKLSIGQELKIKDKTKTIGYVFQVTNNLSGEQSFVITHTDRFVSPVAPLLERLVR